MKVMHKSGGDRGCLGGKAGGCDVKCVLFFPFAVVVVEGVCL